MGFIAWIIMGLIAGAVAKSIMKEGGGWLNTLLVGVVGGFVGGWLGNALFDNGRMTFWSPWSWVLAIGGSCLVLWLWNAINGRHRR